MKTFGIYCSGKAGRVIRFYNKINNNIYTPLIVIYDGNDLNTLNELQDLFSHRLIHFDIKKYSLNETLKIHKTTSDFILKNLIDYNCEFLICFGDKILKSNLISQFKKKLINFHPSLLPAYPGLNSIDQAINSKSVFLGNTAHYINEEIDSGEIIAQSIMLSEDFIIYEDVLELQFPLLKLILRDILEYEITEQEIVSDIKNRKMKYLLPKECNRW